jgi:hypothetical protein
LASYPNTVKECKSDAFFFCVKESLDASSVGKGHHNPAPSIHRSSGSTCHEARATKYILSKDAGVATHRRERRFTWTHPVTGRIRCGDASPGEEVNGTHPVPDASGAATHRRERRSTGRIQLPRAGCHILIILVEGYWLDTDRLRVFVQVVGKREDLVRAFYGFGAQFICGFPKNEQAQRSNALKIAQG